MEVLVLKGADVRALLPMAECIDVVERALVALARGDAVQPLRSPVWLPDRSGLLGVMPGVLEGAGMGLKAVSIMPGNAGTAHDSHQGLVLLFETEHGSPIAILDASSITEIRTAAVSGLATRILAREDASSLAILGSGVQARSHLEAMRLARRIGRVRVWSRREESAREFAHREGSRHGLSIEACATAREAVEGADLICTTTAAREPVLEGAWLPVGAHVNAVGACLAGAREVDTDAVLRSRVFVDRLESAWSEAGDLLLPLEEGAIEKTHVVGELGDVLLGRVPGRRSPLEITLFESLGIAVEDLACARYVHDRALAAGRGTKIDLEGKAP